MPKQRQYDEMRGGAAQYSAHTGYISPTDSVRFKEDRCNGSGNSAPIRFLVGLRIVGLRVDGVSAVSLRRNANLGPPVAN